MRIPLTPHGVPELILFSALFGGGAVAAWLAAGGWPAGIAAAAPFAASLAFVFNFFRDPDRTAPPDPALVIAPADGKVTDILRIDRAPFLDGPAVRIGIFLSVFDVHVNRSPVAGRVTFLQHRPGAFLDARDPQCADLNEAFDLGLQVEDGAGGSFRVLVRQVAGLIARRIVCKAAQDRVLARGERYGMIKFGSRTEVWLPADRVERIEVPVGARVKGGRHPIARLRVKTPALPAGSRT